MSMKRVFAVSALALASSAAMAQSSVTLYGIVDAAVRFENNQPGGGSIKTLVPGGMSQSRLGVNVNEDLGDGWRAMANMEHRLLSDNGNSAAGNEFWRQAWVGLTTPVGRITVGRQYNILFDLTSSTYASYGYSPYIEQFKPELAMNLGNRQSNMVKYAIVQGGLTALAQVSAGEATATQEKTIGVVGRYQMGGLVVGAGYMNSKDLTGKQAKARNFGGSYTTGGLRVNLSHAKNTFDSGFALAGAYGAALIFAAPNGAIASPANLLSSTTAAGVLLTTVKERKMTSVGATYQLTPQFNLGAQYYSMSQSSHLVIPGLNTSTDAKLWSVVGDYALSKRTDVYVTVDRVGFDSPVVRFNGGSTSRMGYMAGVRHRF
jgi:predicted porin